MNHLEMTSETVTESECLTCKSAGHRPSSQLGRLAIQLTFVALGVALIGCNQAELPESYILDDSDSNTTLVRFRGTSQHVEIMRRDGQISMLIVASNPDSIPQAAYSVVTDPQRDRVESFSIAGDEMLTYHLDSTGKVVRVETIRRSNLDSSFRETIRFWPELSGEN
jgi:hypothetical protein